jgi:hypothetical protein
MQLSSVTLVYLLTDQLPIKLWQIAPKFAK